MPVVVLNTIGLLVQRFVVDEVTVGVACGVPVSVRAADIALHPPAFVTSTVYAPTSVAENVAVVAT